MNIYLIAWIAFNAAVTVFFIYKYVQAKKSIAATQFAFEHNGEWHFSTQPELDYKLRYEKWEFLRTHDIKHYYETNEELQKSARSRGVNLTNQEKTS